MILLNGEKRYHCYHCILTHESSWKISIETGQIPHLNLGKDCDTKHVPLFRGHGKNTAHDFICYSLEMHGSLEVGDVVERIDETIILPANVGKFLTSTPLGVWCCWKVHDSQRACPCWEVCPFSDKKKKRLHCYSHCVFTWYEEIKKREIDLVVFRVPSWGLCSARFFPSELDPIEGSG